MENIKEMSEKLALIEAKIDKNVPQSELVFDVDKEEEMKMQLKKSQKGSLKSRLFFCIMF